MQLLQRFPIYRVTVRDPAGPLQLITFLSPSELDVAGGLPSEAIVGRLLRPGPDLVPANFGRNRAFVEFLHAVIRISVPQIGEFVNAARQHGSGWLHIHDARAFSVDPEVAAADIIGSFAVANGVIVKQSYARNEAHRILSEHGMFTPHAEIQDHVLSAMRKLRFAPGRSE